MTNKLTGAFVSGICIVALASPASAQMRVYNIPAGSLKSVLDAYARQSGRPVVYKPDQVSGVQSPGVRGELSVDSALNALLQGTQFHAQTDGTGAQVLVTNNATSLTPPSAAVSASDQASSSASDQAIVVTAQKRQQRLQDVPVPVSTISADTLIAKGQTRVKDFFSSVPGVSYTGGFFAQTVVIRGLSTTAPGGFGNPTVGILVDDVPFGASQDLGFVSAPNIDPSDLSRIEILRGPQGTLYGASSIGGLLKYVTTDPSTERFSGHLQAGLVGVKNGDQLGYNLRGTVNFPLSSNIALLVTGFTRRDPGFVDNVLTGQRAVNDEISSGVRTALLWRPAEGWAVKLGALYEKTQIHGYSEVQAQFGDLKQSLSRGTGQSNPEIQAYTLNVTGRIGKAELTSISAYTIGKDNRRDDLSVLTGLVDEFIPTATGVALVNDFNTKKFSQEIRVSVPLGPHFDWLVGGFYTHESNPHENFFYGVNASTGDLISNAWDNKDYRTFQEYAAFTDLTWKLTDKFDVQVGGRWSHNRQSHAENITGPLVLPLTGVVESVDPRNVSRDSSFTFLVTPRLRISRDLMLYGRIASGYRPGGPNNGCQLLEASGAPCAFGPDRVVNYEVGMKGSTPDHLVSFDASVYHIDWTSIQIVLFNSVAQWVQNAGKAQSQGVELSTELRPTTGLKIAGWVALNQADLRQDFPASAGGIGFKGDWLPNGSRVSANLSVDQQFNLGSNLTGFVGASASYVGRRAIQFRTSAMAPQPKFPAYTKVDITAGLTRGHWGVNAYVTNVTDSRGRIAQDNVTGGFFVINPRTFGLNVTKSF
jgi:outer membrane receptor protein involved in Fe transport